MSMRTRSPRGSAAQEPGGRPPPPRAQSTLLVVLTMAGLGAFFLFEGVRTMRLATRVSVADEPTRRALIHLRVPLDAGPTVLLTIGGFVALLSVLFLVAALGVFRRRSWGREAGGLLAGAFALVATPLAIGGLTAQPPAPEAAQGLLIGLANLGVVVLLLSRSTASDFAAIEHWRARHG